MNLRDLPGSCVLARLDARTLIAVPVGAITEAAARRLANGKPAAGDERALRAWLAAHPHCEVTRVPVPTEQLALWRAA